LSLNNQEAGEEVRSIIGIGKERRYLLPDEEESVLPAAEAAPEPEEGEHHLSPFEQTGIASEDDIAAVRSPHPATDAVEVEHGVVVEEGELDLTPGMLDKNNDPVRLYLREMGTVPLLKRQDGWPSPSAWSAGI
jgi:RNA polymerase primary sigma factor